MPSAESSHWILASHVLLWILVVIQGIIILGLLRQVGLLSLRISPVGARITDDGFKIGEKTPSFWVRDVADPTRRVELPQPTTQSSMVVFLSPQCAMCSQVIDGIHGLLRQTKTRIDWVIVCFGDHAESSAYRLARGLGDVTFFFADREARQDLGIHTVPFALLVGPDGITLSKGIVNHIEHLESLTALVTESALQIGDSDDPERKHAGLSLR